MQKNETPGKLFEASKINLKSYGINIEDFLKTIRIEANYNISETIVFDENFVNLLKNLQKRNNLPETGILDMKTLFYLSKEKKEYFYGKKDLLEKINQYAKDENLVRIETQTELSKEESNLISNNIGPKNEVLAKAKTVLKLSGNSDNMKKQIEDFQRESLLGVDGKIGKKTYAEILAKDFSENRIGKILEKGEMSENDKYEILRFFENGEFASKQWLALTTFLNSFKDKYSKNKNFEEKYGDLYKKFENINKNKTQEPQVKAKLEELSRRDKNLVDQFREDVEKGDYESAITNIVTNPGLLATVGILFLFGVFGSDSKFTNSWLKRLGIIIGGVVLGPTLLDNGKSLFNWIGDGARSFKKELQSNEGQEVFNNAYNWTKGVPSWISNKFSVYSSVVGDKASEYYKNASDLTKEALNKMKLKLGSMEQKNLLFSKSTNEDDRKKAVSQEGFKLLTENLISDNDFGYLEITKLESAKGDVSKIKVLLSDNVKQKLFPDNLGADERKIREEDLVKYINLLLEGKSSGDVRVENIMIGNSLENSISDMVYKVEYFKNKTLNDKIFSLFEKLDNKTRIELSNILNPYANWSLGDIKNQISNFLNTKKLSHENKIIVEQIEKIYLVKYDLDNFEKAIKSEKDIAKLEQIKNKFLEGFNKELEKYPELLVIFTELLNEIYRNNEFNLLNNNEIPTEEEQERLKFLKDFNRVEELKMKIGNLPKVSLESYFDFIVSDKSIALAFLDSQKIYDKYKDKLNSGNEEIDYMLTQTGKFNKNFETLKSNYAKLLEYDLNKVIELNKEIEQMEIREFALSKELKENEILSILGRIYPNQFTGLGNWKELSSWKNFLGHLKDFAFGENNKNIYFEIYSRLGQVDGSINGEKIGELFKKLDFMKKSMLKKQKELEEKQFYLNEEIFSAYKDLYSLLPENFKSKFPNPNIEYEIQNISMSSIKDFLNNFWYVNIIEEKNGDTTVYKFSGLEKESEILQDFFKKYNNLSNLINNFYN